MFNIRIKDFYGVACCLHLSTPQTPFEDHCLPGTLTVQTGFTLKET